jgi:hypothetical protein
MATSFYIRPFSEFTQTSPNIVRGTMSNIHAANSITADGMKAIYTYASFDVKEVLKGDIDKHTITVRKVGGTVDGYTVDIPSSPEFKEGEDTVLFLSPQREDQSYEVSGLELGKFELEEKDGNTVLKGGIFNYSKPDADGDGHSKYAKNLEENQKTWTLKSLRELIQSQKTAAPFPTASKTLPPSVSPSPVIAEPAHTPNTMPALYDSKEHSKNPTSNFSVFTYLIAAILLAAGIFFFLKKK